MHTPVSKFIYQHIFMQYVHCKLGHQFQSLGKYLQPISKQVECLSKNFVISSCSSWRKKLHRASSPQHWESGKFHLQELRFHFLFQSIFFHLNCSLEVGIFILISYLDTPTIFLKICEGFILWRYTCLMMYKICPFLGMSVF